MAFISDKPTNDSTDYCPVCGAHPMEQGEGNTPKELLLSWKEPVLKVLEQIKKQEAGE